MTDKARLTIDLEPALHRKLKLAAASSGMTMREICLRAIRRELERTQTVALSVDEVLTELWDNEKDAVYDKL